MALVRWGRPVDMPRMSTVDGHRLQRCTGVRGGGHPWPRPVAPSTGKAGRWGRPVDTPRMSTVDEHRLQRCTHPQFVHMPIFVGRGWPAGVVRFRAGPPCRPVPRPLLPRRTGDLTPFPPGVD